MVRVLPLAATFLLTLGLAAQRTWTVDASNGPGTDFSDVPPAVAAAADGDTIVVRSGAYDPFSTSKGISILCEGARFPRSLLAPPLVIQGVPAGRQFSLKGASLGLVGGIQVGSCSGRVLFDRIKVDSRAGLVVADCTQVQIHGSQLVGGRPPLSVARSTVAISGSSLQGPDSFSGYVPAFSAIDCTDSTLIFSMGTLTGGSAVASLSGSRPALVATRSTVDLRGDKTTILRAGLDTVTWRPVPGILTDGGTILLDPNVSVVPFNGSPAIGGTAPVTIQRLPALLAQGAPPRGQVYGDLFAQQGDVALFFVGLATDALATPYGMVWWDVNGLWVLTGIGVVDATEHLRHDLPVPMDPALVGPVFVRQALTVPVSGPWLLSNPAAYVAH